MTAKVMARSLSKHRSKKLDLDAALGCCALLLSNTGDERELREGWRRERCSDIASCAVTAHRSLDRLSPLDMLPVSVLAGASSQLRRLDGSSCKDVWTADWACTQLHKQPRSSDSDT